MHYNLRVEMERINGNVVTQIEIASAGRCGRNRLVSPDFDTAMKDLQAEHDKLLKSALDYYTAASATSAVAAPVAPPAVTEANPPAVEASKPSAPAAKKTPAKRKFAKA